jgi:hypothetical protein
MSLRREKEPLRSKSSVRVSHIQLKHLSIVNFFVNHLFAGSLYLWSFDEYNEIYDSLGLARCQPRENEHYLAHGFIDPPVGQWGLQISPVPFLRSLLMKTSCTAWTA